MQRPHRVPYRFWKATFFTAIAVCLVLPVGVFARFVPPTGDPTDNNPLPPVNISGINQSKAGGFEASYLEGRNWVSGGYGEFGLININPDDIQNAGAIQAFGNINATAYCDVFGENCWDPNTGLPPSEGGSGLWTQGIGSNIYRAVGNVGIGVVLPGSKLDVDGVVRALDFCDRNGENCLSDIGSNPGNVEVFWEDFPGGGPGVALLAALSGLGGSGYGSYTQDPIVYEGDAFADSFNVAMSNQPISRFGSGLGATKYCDLNEENCWEPAIDGPLGGDGFWRVIRDEEFDIDMLSNDPQEGNGSVRLANSIYALPGYNIFSATTDVSAQMRMVLDNELRFGGANAANQARVFRNSTNEDQWSLDIYGSGTPGSGGDLDRLVRIFDNLAVENLCTIDGACESVTNILNGGTLPEGEQHQVLRYSNDRGWVPSPHIRLFDSSKEDPVLTIEPIASAVIIDDYLSVYGNSAAGTFHSDRYCNRAITAAEGNECLTFDEIAQAVNGEQLWTRDSLGNVVTDFADRVAIGGGSLWADGIPDFSGPFSLVVSGSMLTTGDNIASQQISFGPMRAPGYCDFNEESCINFGSNTFGSDVESYIQYSGNVFWGDPESDNLAGAINLLGSEFVPEGLNMVSDGSGIFTGNVYSFGEVYADKFCFNVDGNVNGDEICIDESGFIDSGNSPWQRGSNGNGEYITYNGNVFLGDPADSDLSGAINTLGSEAWEDGFNFIAKGSAAFTGEIMALNGEVSGRQLYAGPNPGIGSPRGLLELEGQGVDGDELIRFGIEEPWTMVQDDTGTPTGLAFQADSPYQILRVKTSDDTNVAAFKTGNGGSERATNLWGGVNIFGVASANDYCDASGENCLFGTETEPGVLSGLWSGNGADVWREGGNVGIGTTNPERDIEISKPNPTIKLSTRSGQGVPWYIRATENAFRIGRDVQTDTNLLIDGDGNVALGRGVQGGSRLTVDGPVATWQLCTVANPDGSDASDPVKCNSVRNILDAVDLVFDGDSVGGGNVLWNTDGADVFRVNGNVGIGTNNPQYKLDIQGGSLRADGALQSDLAVVAPTLVATMDVSATEYCDVNGDNCFTANDVQALLSDGLSGVVAWADDENGISYQNAQNSSVGIGKESNGFYQLDVNRMARIGLDLDVVGTVDADDFVAQSNIEIRPTAQITFEHPTNSFPLADGSINFERMSNGAGNLILNPGGVSQSQVTIPDGKQLCLGDDCRTEWPQMLTVTWDQGQGGGFSEGNGNFGRIGYAGDPEETDDVTLSVQEDNGIGARDFVTMTCPVNYVAVGGGVICEPGEEISANGHGTSRDEWRVSCGTQLNAIQKVNVSCMLQ